MFESLEWMDLLSESSGWTALRFLVVSSYDSCSFRTFRRPLMGGWPALKDELVPGRYNQSDFPLMNEIKLIRFSISRWTADFESSQRYV
jgi:hypothetical protein